MAEKRKRPPGETPGETSAPKKGPRRQIHIEIYSQDSLLVLKLTCWFVVVE